MVDVPYERQHDVEAAAPVDNTCNDLYRSLLTAMLVVFFLAMFVWAFLLYRLKNPLTHL